MIMRNCLTFLTAQVAVAAPSPLHQRLPPAPSVKTIFSLPDSNSSWLENLAYRPATNTILATRLGVAQLWSISAGTGAGTLLANVTDLTALLGITQTRSSPDEFYVAGVNFSAAGVRPNSSVLWRLAFQPDEGRGDADGVGRFTFERALGLPGVGLINGLTTWDDHTVLATDSHRGAVWKVDVLTGSAVVVLQDPSMAPVGSNGANGVRVLRAPGRRAYVYYTSTDRSLLARIPVDPTTALPSPPDAAAEIIARDLGEADDFALLEDGGVVLATGWNNTLVRVRLDGSVETVAGNRNSLELASATSCQLGGRHEDGKGRTLYATTAGGEEGAVNGTEAAGSVVAVDIVEDW